MEHFIRIQREIDRDRERERERREDVKK